MLLINESPVEVTLVFMTIKTKRTGSVLLPSRQFRKAYRSLADEG